MNKYQQYRKDNGLCLDCGEMAAKGKTRCIRCLQIIAAKQKMREHQKREADPEGYREAKNRYRRNWEEKNPDKVAVYRQRKSEYNKRYNWAFLRGENI